jgi:peptidoglycan/LPS O-acetylase OafA/YrhL
MPRLASLQALRALAANMVVVSHLCAIEHKRGDGLLPTIAENLVVGVDFFFVLSGFVMAHVASTVTPREFILARVTRIYPTWWFYLTAVVVAAAVLPSGMVNASLAIEPSLWRSYLLLPQMGPPLLAVGWTLTHEVYFYSVFALILVLRLPLVPALAVWLTAVVLLQPMRDGGGPWIRLALHPMTAEFVLGAVAALVLERRPKYGPQTLIIGSVLFLAALAVWTSDGSQS